MKAFFKKLWDIITAPFVLLWRLITWPFKAVRQMRAFLNEPVEDRPLLEALDNAFAPQEGVSIFERLAPHIEDLRKHLLRMLIGLSIGVAIAFAFTQPALNYLAQPAGGLDNLKAIEVTESIGIFMKIALLVGVAISSPYLAFEIWHFLAPGLLPRTRKSSLMAIPLVVLFFLGGMAFAFYVMLPAALPFLQDFMGMQAQWRPGSYFSFVANVMFWIGLTFEFPLIIYVITALGWLKPQTLADQGRLAIVLIAVLAAAVTPTVDPINMALVMGPMIVLYYFSIFLSKLAYRGREKRLAEAEGEENETAP